MLSLVWPALRSHTITCELTITFLCYNVLFADEVLQKNPTMLVNIEEADLEADPLYGEITTAG
jgi:hypothetical protein